MQDSLHEKLEAVKETLGIVFPGLAVTMRKQGTTWKFNVDGKALRFSEDFLTAYDVDHILSMCHLGIAELRSRPTDTTIHIGAHTLS
ncbi:MAG: hypothetical protein JWN13_2891 [Betaproteobacteria bacterium]|jgi:hypothetical protein|nr:hypothetical protein [Betaproteobacteria bacterium]